MARAEELPTIAELDSDTKTRKTLTTIALSYEQLATSLDAIDRADRLTSKV